MWVGVEKKNINKFTSNFSIVNVILLCITYPYRVELTLEAREVKEELYCLRCHDRMGIPICGACHRPIDGERVVTALGKHWHVEVKLSMLDFKTFLYQKCIHRFFLAAFCLCKVWKAFPGSSTLWEKGISLLWNTLSSVIWKFMLCMQSSHCWWRYVYTLYFNLNFNDYVIFIISVIIVFTALNKAWHVDHFTCYFCDSLMSQK